MKKLRKSTELKSESLKKDIEAFQTIPEEEKFETVKKKIQKQTSSKFDQKNLENLASKLSEKKKLQKYYLNTNFKAVLEYFDLEQEKTTTPGAFSSSNSTPKSLVSEFRDEFEDEIIQERILEYPETKTVNEKIKIKLVLTENVRTDFKKSMRKIASPFVNAFNIGDSELGMFHSAISIGPWYLEWDNSGNF